MYLPSVKGLPFKSHTFSYSVALFFYPTAGLKIPVSFLKLKMAFLMASFISSEVLNLYWCLV